MEIRMTEGDISGKITKKCPYCFRNVVNSDAAFLLRPAGMRFQSPALNNLAAEKTDQPYVTFWSAMGMNRLPSSRSTRPSVQRSLASGRRPFRSVSRTLR